MSLLLALQGGGGGETINLNCPAPTVITAVGLAASLTIGLTVPVPQVLAMWGAQTRLTKELGATPAQLTFSADAPSISIQSTTDLNCPAPTVMTLAGQQASLVKTLNVPNAQVLTMWGTANRLTKILGCPEPTTLTAQGVAPSLTVELRAPSASMVLQGLTPTLEIFLAPVFLECPPPVEMSFSSQAPTLVRGLNPEPGTMALSSDAPTLGISLGAQPGSMTLQGLTPSIGSNLNVPAPAVMAFTADAPVIARALPAAEPTVMTFTTEAPSLVMDLQAAPAALLFDLPLPWLYKYSPPVDDGCLVLLAEDREETIVFGLVQVDGDEVIDLPEDDDEAVTLEWIPELEVFEVSSDIPSYKAKFQEASKRYGMNFRRQLSEGEVIESCNWTVEVASGIDPSPELMLVDGCDITQAPLVKQQIAGGVRGVRYLLKASATAWNDNTSSGRTLVGAAYLTVR